MDGKSIYKIVIKPGGNVLTTLVKEGANQTAACANILQLAHSMGQMQGHDEHRTPDQPVEVNLKF